MHVAVKHNMQRMSWYDEVDQKVTIENKMLDRMHRNTDQRPNVNIPVVYRVRNSIQWWPVKCS